LRRAASPVRSTELCLSQSLSDVSGPLLKVFRRGKFINGTKLGYTTFIRGAF
jgi:hypothetical protein